MHILQINKDIISIKSVIFHLILPSIVLIVYPIIMPIGKAI